MRSKLNYHEYPKNRCIVSTSMLRMNEEIKCRSRVIGIFPKNAAIVGPVGTLPAERADEWQVARRYMSREVLAKVVARDEK